MHMKFEIEISKKIKIGLRKLFRLQTDRQTEGESDNVIPVYSFSL